MMILASPINCVRSEGVQGVLTLFCSGAAQAGHDDRAVELKEQLEVEEEDGDRPEEKVEKEREKRVKVSAPWMTMQMEVWMRNLNHEVCGFIINLWNKDARAVSVHAHHASVEMQVHCVNVVIIGVPALWSACWCTASFQLLFVMMLYFVTHLFAQLFTIAIVFIAAILRRILLYWRYGVYTHRRWQLTAVGCHRILNCKWCSTSILRIIPRVNIPITFQQVSLINQGWVRLRGDAHKKNATRILASSTKMRNSFAIFADELHPLGVWAVAKLTVFAWSEVDAKRASYQNQLCSNESNNCFCTHEFLLEWCGACGLCWPICPSHHTFLQCDRRQTHFLRNFSSRMTRSWTPKKFFFLHFFLSEFAMKCSWSPGFFP